MTLNGTMALMPELNVNDLVRDSETLIGQGRVAPRMLDESPRYADSDESDSDLANSRLILSAPFYTSHLSLTIQFSVLSLSIRSLKRSVLTQSSLRFVRPQGIA